MHDIPKGIENLFTPVPLVSTFKALPVTPGFLVAPWALLALLAAFKELFGLLIKIWGTGSRCAT